MIVSSIHGLQRYVKQNSGFSGKTVNSVVCALGYHPLHSALKDFKELSGVFVVVPNTERMRALPGSLITATQLIFFSNTAPTLLATWKKKPKH